jgi:hypothetical protein
LNSELGLERGERTDSVNVTAIFVVVEIIFVLVEIIVYLVILGINLFD